MVWPKSLWLCDVSGPRLIRNSVFWVLCCGPIKRSRKGYLWLWSQTIEWNPVSFPLWKKGHSFRSASNWALGFEVFSLNDVVLPYGDWPLRSSANGDGDWDVLLHATAIKNPCLRDRAVFSFNFLPLLCSPFLHFSTLSSSLPPLSPPPLISPRLEKTTGWICVAPYIVSAVPSPHSQTRSWWQATLAGRCYNHWECFGGA